MGKPGRHLNGFAARARECAVNALTQTGLRRHRVIKVAVINN